MNSAQIAELRENYTQATLDEQDLSANPFDQFRTWIQEAVTAEVKEPNAMSLGTVDAAGHPSVRIVLLKGITERGFVFYTNYQSTKAQELAAHSHAALNFFWPELERQVRIKGRVEKVPESVADAYFAGRPRGSRIGAWASPQSQEISGRSVLEENLAELMARFGESGEVPRPSHWGGYVVLPEEIEFWQGRSSRLHDRHLYRKDAQGTWTHVRLAP